MLRTRVWRPVGGSNQSRIVVIQANIGDTVRSPRRDVGTEGQSTRARGGVEMPSARELPEGKRTTLVVRVLERVPESSLGRERVREKDDEEVVEVKAVVEEQEEQEVAEARPTGARRRDVRALVVSSCFARPVFCCSRR